jgi:enoyl-CoA hydratase/carnithine racemase
MDKVRFEISGPLGILTLANPPLNLFSGELIEDLRTAVTEIKRAPIRAQLVRAEGNIFSGGADVSIFQGR